jgi:hypothetical protein
MTTIFGTLSTKEIDFSYARAHSELVDPIFLNFGLCVAHGL